MPADHDQMSLMLCGLQHDYPGWCFAVRHCYDGPRLGAYRPQVPDSGLYALITADPAEMRRELDNA